MMRVVVFLVALLCTSLSFSQALPNTAIPVWSPSLVGSTYTFNGASVTSANAANISFGNAANGPLYAEARQSLAVGGGRAASVVVRAAPVMSAVAKAIGGFAGGPFVGTLVAGVALYDLAKELGFNVDNASGSVVVTKSNTVEVRRLLANACQGNGQVDGSLSSLASVCQARYQSGVYSGSTCYPSGTTQIYCDRGPYGPVTVGTQFVSSNVTSVPSTNQELQDAITAKSSWPSSSALPRAVTDAVNSGQPLALPSPSSITGPASVVGPSATSTTPAQNGKPASTTTTTTNYNINYGPNTVNVVENKTIVINDGTTTTTTTETKEPEPDPAPTDTGLPGQPDLYKQKYPDGIKGIWTARKAELMATPIASLPSNLMPSIPTAGAYPSWPIPVIVGHWNFGTYDVSPAPMVWDFLRVCVLIGALFLARALIFGG